MNVKSHAMFSCIIFSLCLLSFNSVCVRLNPKRIVFSVLKKSYNTLAYVTILEFSSFRCVTFHYQLKG